MKLWRWLRSRPLARVRRTIATRKRAEEDRRFNALWREMAGRRYDR